ncbi:MAG: sigma-54-dependent Fis family transcriptional regulator [Proteobacteria bacterium]|nr:sigma-54-dependent Fis family transcriptional regulator [Pseudomonadota bacterium]
MGINILVVDDEESIRSTLSGILSDEGFSVILAEDGTKALTAAREESPDLVLLDIWMPELDGMETLEKMKVEFPSLPVIMMSGHGTIETAVQATKLGAYDFIEKPLSIEKVLLSAKNALSLHRLEEENRRLKEKYSGWQEMVGESDVMKELKEQVAIVAPSNAWALITGENGTGKELVANMIHRKSKRAGKPFVDVNCAAIPENLIESELFGHEKGAFTGAVNSKRGKFDLANEGTLFLDEIADMSLKTQAKILRILQEQRFERVGGSRSIKVDVRVIAATNKDLSEEISLGNFREDLYYRLNVIPFEIPPLRERTDDIPFLVEKFVKLYSAEAGCEVKSFDEEAMGVMKRYHWPGNIRELKNLVERLVIMTPGSKIEKSDLPPYVAGIEKKGKTFEKFGGLKEAKAAFEEDFIRSKLEENDGNVTKTAEAIGLERTNLHRKIKSYGIELT